MHKLKVTYVPTESLRAYTKNAKEHSQNQVLEIARSIQQFGFTNPIIVDDLREVIAGHGRLLAALHLGLDQVPVVQLSHLSESQKRGLRLADNRIAQNSSWNYDLLRTELQELDNLEVDLTGLGFSDGEIAQWVRSLDNLELPKVKSESFSIPQAPEPAPTIPAPEPAAVWAEPMNPSPASAPKATDDGYSKFELIMEHSNKINLVECLDDIRSDFSYEKIEDALMHLVRHYYGED